MNERVNWKIVLYFNEWMNEWMPSCSKQKPGDFTKTNEWINKWIEHSMTEWMNRPFNDWMNK